MADIAEPRRYEVIVDGGYFFDLLFTGLPRIPVFGTELFAKDFALFPGWAYRTALAFRHLEIPVGWAVDFGTDLFSRYVMEEAARNGIDDSLFRVHARPVRRVSAAMVRSGNHAFASFMDDLDVASVGPLLEIHRPAWIVLGGFENGERFWDIIAHARRAGTRVFMDCQGVERTIGDADVSRAIGAVDVIAANEQEARQLAGETRLGAVVATLSSLGPTVVVKRGRRGSMAIEGGRLWRAPALPVVVESTVGAGDSFSAGFLYALIRGGSVGDGLRFGNVVGGLASAAQDGSLFPGPQRLEELAKTLDLKTSRPLAPKRATPETNPATP